MDELCDELAIAALDLEEKLDDDMIATKVSNALGSTSPTMQETFNTAIRVRRAHRRAAKTLEALAAGEEAPDVGMAIMGDDPGGH